MRAVLHNTVAKGYKNFLSIGSDNVGFIVDRRRYDFRINGVDFKLPKKFTVLEYLKNLHMIATIDLDNVVDGKNKDLLIELKPNAILLYKNLGFNYSTFVQFKNSIRVITLS